jgi:hypothetical protein
MACGGNIAGISGCIGSGSCGPGCVNCGASTHWYAYICVAVFVISREV